MLRTNIALCALALIGMSSHDAASDADRIDEGDGLDLDNGGDRPGAALRSTQISGMHQTGADARHARGYKGRSLYALLDAFYWDTVINSYPQVAQVDTITVDTATNSFAYTITIAPEFGGDSVVVTYTADGSTSTSEVSAGLVAAINADPIARGVLVAADLAGSFTLTALVEGQGFTATVGTVKLSNVHTTADVNADAVTYGRGVVTLARSSDGEKYGSVPVAARFTAQVETFTVVYGASDEYFVQIEMEDEKISVNVAANTDTATTTTAIVTAINAAMEAHPAGAGNSVLAASGVAGTVTLTSEVPGKAFKVSYGTRSGTATRLVLAHTTAGPTTDLWRVFEGFASAVYDQESAGGRWSAYSDAYPPNEAMKVQRSDAIWVYSTETPTSSDAVYMETAAGAACGRVYTTGSATRIKAPKGAMTWLGMVNGGSGSDACVALTFNRLAPA